MEREAGCGEAGIISAGLTPTQPLFQDVSKVRKLTSTIGNAGSGDRLTGQEKVWNASFAIPSFGRSRIDSKDEEGSSKDKSRQAPIRSRVSSAVADICAANSDTESPAVADSSSKDQTMLLSGSAQSGEISWTVKSDGSGASSVETVLLAASSAALRTEEIDQEGFNSESSTAF
jgi:hypothetical protein